MTIEDTTTATTTGPAEKVTTVDDDDTSAHWLDDAEGIDDDAQDDAEPTENDDEVDDSGDDDDEPQEDDEPVEKKPGVRQRLKDAEAARDSLTAALDKTRQMVFDRAVADSGVDEKFRAAFKTVLKADGFDIAHVCDDDGVPDLEELAGNIGMRLRESGLPYGARAPRPNPIAGRMGGASPQPEKATFASVLKEHVESSGIDRK